MIKTFWV